MELSKLKSAEGARKKRKRVARGPSSGHGKTAGRGHKGAKSRSGFKAKTGFEGGQMPLHRRLPKRGFRHESRWPMAVINVDVLEARFEDGAEVDGARLVAMGLALEKAGGVKLLGRGEVSKKLNVTVQAASPGAKAKIEAAGGVVTIVAASRAATAEE